MKRYVKSNNFNFNYFYEGPVWIKRNGKYEIVEDYFTMTTWADSENEAYSNFYWQYMNYYREMHPGDRREKYPIKLDRDCVDGMVD